MAKSAKEKNVWAGNVYRDALDRARVCFAKAGERLGAREFQAALVELEGAQKQLSSLVDLLRMVRGA